MSDVARSILVRRLQRLAWRQRAVSLVGQLLRIGPNACVLVACSVVPAVGRHDEPET
ncbi:hypothetical protein ACFV20_07130 [Streptomyces sp. NPDC059696]|uniref:hypothetical protein n=1 Tax=Streptomyces sp. NPDC059696 TaxID=3346911 RepID=UPI0036B77AD8